MASNTRSVPMELTMVEYSAVPKDVATLDCAAKWYISSGRTLAMRFRKEDASRMSP